MFLIPKCQNYIFVNAHIFFYFFPLHSYNSSILLLYEDSHPYSPHSHPDSPQSPHSHSDSPHSDHSHPDFPHSHHSHPDYPHSHHSHPDFLNSHPDSPYSHHSPHSVPRFPIPTFTDSQNHRNLNISRPIYLKNISAHRFEDISAQKTFFATAKPLI